MVNYITAQEMFNKVWERAKIPQKSLKGITCAYRNDDGSNNHCFVGICISDEDYRSSFEGESARFKGIQELFPNVPVGTLIDLQLIHDQEPPESWEHKLRIFAKDNLLTIPE